MLYYFMSSCDLLGSRYINQPKELFLRIHFTESMMKEHFEI